MLYSLPRDHFPEAGEDGTGVACEKLPELHGVSVAMGTARGSLWHPRRLALLQHLPGAGEEGWEARLSCGKGEESDWAISRGLGQDLWAPCASDPAGLQMWGRQNLLPRELLISAHVGEQLGNAVTHDFGSHHPNRSQK